MGSIKIRNEDLRKLEEQLKSKVEKSLKDSRLLNEVGEYTQKNIVGDARVGKGYTENKSKRIVAGENQTKLKPLEGSTIKQRERIAQRNPTGVLYAPRKSNITLTGQTLESISYKISNGKPKLQIIADGQHRGYLQKNGKRTKPVKFKDIIKWLSEKGRNIFGISPRMYKSIIGIIKQNLRRQLK